MEYLPRSVVYVMYATVHSDVNLDTLRRGSGYATIRATMAGQQEYIPNDASFDLDAAVLLFEVGMNVYDVCQRLNYNREAFVGWVKADEKRMERVTESRRQGADSLVSDYKTKLMQEFNVCEDQRDRISILKEIGTHIRWEAAAVHSGTYAPRTVTELAGKLKLTHDITLTPEQIREMAKEVLATPGDAFGKPPTSA